MQSKSTRMLAAIAALYLNSIVASVHADPKIDPRAEALEKQCLAASHKIRTFQAHVEFRVSANGTNQLAIGRIVLARPNLIRQDIWNFTSARLLPTGYEKSAHDIIISNGHKFIQAFDDGSVQQSAVTADAIENSETMDLNGIVSPEFSPFDGQKVQTVTLCPAQVWRSTMYRVLKLTFPSSKSGPNDAELFIGDDDLVHRAIVLGSGGSVGISLTDIVLNARIPKSKFALMLPVYETQTTSSPTAIPQPKVDRRARRILDAVEAKLKRTKCLTADFVNWNQSYFIATKKYHQRVVSEGSFMLSKPNYAFVHSWYVVHKHGTLQANKELEQYSYCDGRSEWRDWDLKNNYYERSDIDDNAGPISSSVIAARCSCFLRSIIRMVP